jgi:hypothetical protein
MKAVTLNVCRPTEKLPYSVCSLVRANVQTLCGQNVDFVNVTPAGTHSEHKAIR